MKRHLKMESDTESTNSTLSDSPRLGKCEVCNNKDAKYTCPKCEVKTCCVPCIQIHKKELNCDGIRDKTKYIPIKKMTKMDFMNDYHFLEECTRYVEDRKRDRIKHFTRFNKKLPTRLFRLRNAALERKIKLKFLLENFTRHRINTSYFDFQSKVIYWHVEWIFTNAGNLKFVDEKCCENETIANLLDKYLNLESNQEIPMKKLLEFYQSRGIGNLEILLKAEGIKNCKNRFYQIDVKKSLKDNLAGKTILEFPYIYVNFKECVEMFDIIDSDDDVLTETQLHYEALDQFRKEQIETCTNKKSNNVNDEDVQNELKKLLIEKKREERRKKREELEKEPQNLLFADEKLWELYSSSDETEEELNENGE